MPNSEYNYIRRRLLQGMVATWLLSVSRVGFAASPSIFAVHIWFAPSYIRVTLKSNVTLKYRTFTISVPDRLVLDIEDLRPNSMLSQLSEKVWLEDLIFAKYG